MGIEEQVKRGAEQKSVPLKTPSIELDGIRAIVLWATRFLPPRYASGPTTRVNLILGEQTLGLNVEADERCV